MKLMSGVFCSFFLFFRAEKRNLCFSGRREEKKSFSRRFFFLLLFIFFWGVNEEGEKNVEGKVSKRVAKWKVKLEKNETGMR